MVCIVTVIIDLPHFTNHHFNHSFRWWWRHVTLLSDPNRKNTTFIYLVISFSLLTRIKSPLKHFWNLNFVYFLLWTTLTLEVHFRFTNRISSQSLWHLKSHDSHSKVIGRAPTVGEIPWFQHFLTKVKIEKANLSVYFRCARTSQYSDTWLLGSVEPWSLFLLSSNYNFDYLSEFMHGIIKCYFLNVVELG